ncbi:exodeoxyribonuclease VII small subunit [Sphingomonas sp. Leaf412]|uniref:exodeoxyribonuclease VII small subunit n=1 Tax=Sphingomonas sp. Leaf412 TaxID=1736370 RepID=UPI0006FB9FAC|nr:exodeoxyribonuclease VII small subunit [Sphingomonas sp. Leaf412]KQT34761.1 exodeoxyribonuclease VII small subunit [Sphingomonas sp. Leaf412]
MDHSPPAPIESLSFEAALKELEQIVGRLESGDTPLDDAIALYERGSALRGHCAQRLDAAQARIESIRLGSDGAPAGTKPFDPAPTDDR